MPIETPDGLMPRCEIGDWPETFDPPPVDSSIPESLPPPFDEPDQPSQASNVEVFAYGHGTRARLDTFWTSADYPPVLQLGYSASVDGRVDVYCMVDGLPHTCRWTDEESTFLTFASYDPVRAWNVTLVDPPLGGFDWSLLLAQQHERAAPSTELYLERVFVFNEIVSAAPRFETSLWNRAIPGLGRASATVTFFPPPDEQDWTADRVLAHVQLQNTEDTEVTIPAEVSFLAAGSTLPVDVDGGTVDRWIVNIEPGTARVDVPIHLDGVASGEPILIHAIAYPGIPHIGSTPDGELCVSASVGVNGGLNPIQYQSLLVP